MPSKKAVKKIVKEAEKGIDLPSFLIREEKKKALVVQRNQHREISSKEKTTNGALINKICFAQA
jgi:hypothetical protein